MTKRTINFTVKEILSWEAANELITFETTAPIQIGNQTSSRIRLKLKYDSGMRLPQINEGDILTIRGLEENHSGIRKLAEGSILIPNVALYEEVIVRTGDRKVNNQVKVLSWIWDGEFRLRIDFTMDNSGADRIVFYNVESHEFIDAKDLVDPNAILNELVDYIRKHPGDFQLGAWRHLNQAVGSTPPWWQYDRLIKSRLNENIIIHPAVFSSENQYQQVYDLLVDNLSVTEYNQIDDEDQELDYLRQNQFSRIQQDNPGLTQSEIINQFGRWINESVRQPFVPRNPRRRIPGWEKELYENQDFRRIRIIFHRVDERYIQFVRYHNYQVNRENQDWKGTLAKFYHYQPLFQNSPSLEQIEKLLTESLDREGNTATSPMQYLTIPQTFSELERIDEHIQQVRKINNLIGNQREKIWRLIKKLYKKFEIAFQKWQEQQEQKDKEESIEDNFPENNNSGSEPKTPTSSYLFPENDNQANENKDEKSIETGSENETKRPRTSIPTDKDQSSSSPQTSQTDEINTNTPLPEAQKLAITKIQKLLEANSLQVYDLPSEYQNWKEAIQKLETTEAIINYLSQMEKIIITQSQIVSQRVNNSVSLPKPDKNLPLFFLGLVVITIGGGLIVLLTKFFKNK